MKNHIILLPLLVASLSACKKSSPPETNPAPAPSVVSPSPTASALPPVTSVSVTDPPPFVAPPFVPIGDDMFPMYVVAESVREQLEGPGYWAALPNDTPRPFHIHAMRDRMLVTGDGSTVYELEGGKLKEAEFFEANQFLSSGYAPGSLFAASDILITGIAGRWPSDIYMTVFGTYTDGARLSTLTSETYVREGGGRFSRASEPVAASAWSRGRTLALSKSGFTVSPSSADLPKRVEGKSCKIRIEPEAMAALPNGEVLVVGRDCDAMGRLALERWEPEKTESTISPLPTPDEKLVKVSVLANERWRYVLANYEKTTVLLSIYVGPDGVQTTTPEPLPLEGAIRSAAMAPDGTLFLIFGRGKFINLIRRGTAGAYEFAHLSEKEREVSSIEGMYAASRDTVYLAASTSELRSVIFSSKPGKLFDENPSGKHPKPASSALDGPASGPPKPLGSSCTTPFVILFSISDTAPPDYDYPATRDALSGWPDASKYKFIEYKNDKGKRTLGAIAPDRGSAEALDARLRERVKGARPAPVCFKPGASDVGRELKLAGGG